MPGMLYIIVPMFFLVIDFGIDYLNFGRNTFVSRSVTGGLLGVSTAFFIVPIWISLMAEFRENRNVSLPPKGGATPKRQSKEISYSNEE